MGVLLINSGDPAWTIQAGGTSTTNVYGTTGVDTVNIESGAKVVLDSSFNAGTDKIYIQGDSTSYKVSNLGAVVTLTDATGNTIVVPAGAVGQTLVFGDGSAILKIDGTTLKLGTQTVTTTATAVATTAITAGSATSDSQFGTVTVTPEFSVAPVAATVAEGSNAQFTVTLTNPPTTGTTTVVYTLTGTGATLGTDTGTHTPAGNTGTLSFPAGTTTQTVTLPIVKDTLPETGEKINITLSGASSGSQVSTTAGTSSITLTDDLTDTTAPTCTAANIDGARTSISLSFSEPLGTAGVPATAAFTGTATSGGVTTGLNISSVGISGSSVILTLGTAVASGATVNLTYATPTANPLEDAVGNDAANFTIAVNPDTAAPTLSSSTPADNATDVVVGSNVVLTFNETVKAGTGNLTIVNSTNSTDTRTIAVTDTTQVTFSGTTVTINPTADLSTAASYYVTMGSGVILDVAGNPYAGISDGGTLNFSTPGGSTGTAGTTINLTQFDDTGASFTGTANNDTFNGTAGTLNSGDVLNGNGGTDSLNALGVAGTIAPTLTEIDNISIRTDGSAAEILSLAKATGYTQLTNDRSTDDLTFAGISSTSVNLVVKNAEETTFTFASVGGSTDTATLKIIGSNTGAAGVTIAGIETLNVSGELDATTGASTTKLTVANLTNLNLTGSTNLNVGDLGNTATTTTTINGSGMTAGGFKVKIANTGTVNVTGSSYDDYLILSSVDNVDNMYTVNLGLGTDVLAFADEVLSADALQTDFLNVTGYEALAFNTHMSATLDLAGATVATGFASIKDLRIFGSSAATADFDFSNVSTETVITIESAVGNVSADNTDDFDTFTITSFFGAGAKDLTIKLNGTAGTGTNDGELQIDEFVFEAGVGTVTLHSTGGSSTTANVITTNNTSNAKKLIITGDKKLELTNLLDTDTVNVDASAFKAALVVTTSATATEVRGGDGADTITGAAAADVLKGNAGNDSITGVGGADTLTGGAGNDTLVGGAAIDSIVLTDGGNDLVSLSGIVAAANRDTITGFSAGAVADLDVIGIATAETTANTPAGSTVRIQEQTTAPTAALTWTTTAATGNDILELAFDLTGDGIVGKDLDLVTDGTNLLAALAQTLNISAVTEEGYILAYQGGNAYLYYVVEDNDAVALEAGEIFLVGVLSTVSVGAFTTNNFAIIA